MKYMISWFERPQGSPDGVRECPEADPGSLHSMEGRPPISRSRCSWCAWASGAGICWWTATIRAPFTRSARRWPAFVFEARPVIPVADAVRVELETIAWRDGLKRKFDTRTSNHMNVVGIGDTLGASKTLPGASA